MTGCGVGVVNNVVMTTQILPQKYMSLNGKVNALVSLGHPITPLSFPPPAGYPTTRRDSRQQPNHTGETNVGVGSHES